MSNDTLLMTMLFDFFGDLLTDRQREYYDLYYNEDLSLSEIAVKTGITRQGVHDVISRAENSLLEMEQKTGVVKRWQETRKELCRAEAIAWELLLLSKNNVESANLALKLLRIMEGLEG
ncbi:MAG: DNA-binding protein [Oscillospiraceae bacterium]|nr:DNA-binding protein [Oscillospiraceae bacterium]